MTKTIPTIVKPRGSRGYTDLPIGISGPPGVGKSTIGKKVANKLGVPFYDLDSMISKKAGLKTPKEIVDKRGRPYFWKHEHACLKEFFKKKRKRYVLSFSGGVICHKNTTKLKEKNKSLIKKNIFHICLMPSRNSKDSLDILWPRHSDGKRTSFENPKHFQLYLRTRMSQYTSGADRIVYTHHAPTKEVVDAVMKIFIL